MAIAVNNMKIAGFQSHIREAKEEEEFHRLANDEERKKMEKFATVTSATFRLQHSLDKLAAACTHGNPSGHENKTARIICGYLLKV